DRRDHRPRQPAARRAAPRQPRRTPGRARAETRVGKRSLGPPATGSFTASGGRYPRRVIDEDYFREWLTTLLTEYAELHDLERNTTELLVAVELADGTILLVIAWRAWADWIVLFTEDDGMHTVPYERITKVSVLARPTP